MALATNCTLLFAGAPVNITAKQQCVRQWKAGAEGAVRQLPCKEIEEATNGFCELSLISSGASCQVFTGHLYGLFVAVKQLKEQAAEWDDRQFTAGACRKT